MFTTPHQYKTTLSGREEVTPGTFRLSFRFDTDTPFGFSAGQYAWVQLPELAFPDPRGPQRAFSIASDPAAPETISILFRASESGFKKSLLALEVGAPVIILGPFGQFTLPAPKECDSLVFIGGGVGIAPFLSLLPACAKLNPARPITLIYSESAPEREIPEVQNVIEKTEERLSMNVVYCYGPVTKKVIETALGEGGKPSAPLTPERERGPLQNPPLNSSSSPFPGRGCPTGQVRGAECPRTLFYLSGPAGMINVVAAHLLALGVSPSQMRFDEHYPLFAGEKDATDTLVHSAPDPRDPFGVQTRAVPGEVNYYRLISEDSLSYIVVTDINGHILYANKTAEESTGYTFDEMKGNTPRLWGGLMDAEFYRTLWRTVKIERKMFRGKVENRRKNGGRYTVILTISPIVREDGSGDLIGFVAREEDITDRERIDQAKTEFVSLASHQLQTPLSAVKWAVETLLGGDAGALVPAQKEFADMIWENNERMIRTVNSLLDISLIEAGTLTASMKIVHVRKVIDAVVRGLLPRFEEKQLHFTAAYGKELPDMRTDPDFLTTIVENLLTNALKYTPAGGTVSLMAAWSPHAGGKLNIRVADSGYGIPLEAQSRIFSKFFRAENVKNKDIHGAGLGLHIVKLIVENMRGNILVDSEEGRGSIFIVTLPVGE